MGENFRWFQAEYENALDDIYYGYGYKFWYEQEKERGTEMTEEESKYIWKQAWNKMANS